MHKSDPTLEYLIYKGTPRAEQTYIFDHIIDNQLLSGTVMMKTGRGKTHLIMQLIAHLKVPTLILCHNINTTIQTKGEFQEFTNVKPEHISSVCTGSKDKFSNHIDITTHVGFKKHAEKLRGKYKLIIYDECDFNISYPYGRNYDKAMTTALIRSDADMMFGLSGTPFKQEAGVEGVTLLFGDMITMPGQEMNGYNMLPQIKRILYDNPTTYIFEGWHELRVQMYEDELRFSKQINYIYENKTKYNLVLFKNVKETELYCAGLKRKFSDAKAGTEAEIVLLHGQLGARRLKEEQDKFGGLRDKGLKTGGGFTIVATADVIGRGVDIPEIDTVFLFFPSKFKGTIVQAVGRALRFSPGKGDVLVHDRCDVPLLARQASERKKAYKQEYTDDVLITDINLDGNKNLFDS